MVDGGIRHLVVDGSIWWHLVSYLGGRWWKEKGADGGDAGVGRW